MNIIDTYSLMFLYPLATVNERNIGVLFDPVLDGCVRDNVREVDIQVGNQLGI
ncbi:MULTISPECIES: hypothetical protein [Aeromonas]|uniref:hypothetical protein n=1 Tax=Aeromonas TaxID=642 RepID=UPI001FFF645C|nr:MULTISPECIES: hypothetical protein [Aeromonas]UPK53758.1 hypothetical protein MYF86_14840 [Aeromonas veronii]WMW30797.1 hypothetical protein [Aeromonas veronii]